MKPTEALLWITSVCVGLRKSQIKTLADLVSVAIDIGRVSLSELGRLLAEERQGAATDAIKRAWRFTSNVGVHISDAMQGPRALAVRQSEALAESPTRGALRLDEGALF